MAITENGQSETTEVGLTAEEVVPEYKYPYLYKGTSSKCACGVPTNWRVYGGAVCTICLSIRYKKFRGLKPWEEEEALRVKSEAARTAVMITQGKKCAHCGNKRRRLIWLEPTTMDTLVCSSCLDGALYGTRKTDPTWKCGLCGTTIGKKRGEEIVNHFRGHYLFAENTAGANN